MQRDVFESLANAICQPGADDERITLYLAGETSEFIRLNQARVRQATTVRQQGIDLTVVRGQRCLSSRLSMPDDAAQCLAMLQTELAALRDMLALVPEDPHLLLSDTISNSERIENAAGLPDADAIIADLIGAAGPEDLVGFYAAGPVQRAFADSRGQRNWHEVASFHLEWSLFSRHPESRDQAVKSTLAGSAYSPADLQTRMDAARARLAMLEQPRKTLAPGRYRAWLAPTAVAELLQVMAWSGFSRKEQASGTSSLSSLTILGNRLNQQVQINEAIESGIAPAFTTDGRTLPDRVALVTDGLLTNRLSSARTAAEFDEHPNAIDSESPQALAMAGGTISEAQSLAALDTGLWIGNLWYLNYSDRQAARVTGMTRFACFWVENGRIQAPIGVMRFDESLLNLFGNKLEGLGSDVDFLPSANTWGERELSSVSCPGMLVSDLTLTL